MNIGRTVKVFTAEPLVSPVPAAEEPPAGAVPGPVPEPVPERTRTATPNPVAPTRTTATATR